MKDYTRKVTQISAEKWEPAQDFAIKPGDTVNGIPVYMDEDGFYLQTAGGSVYRPGCYVDDNNGAHDAARFETDFEEKKGGAVPAEL